ncbi:MAG: [FeFe] hydrogenase H-cluster radical SAM maturase HydG [Candidatus Omnitrophica bacterium]|nr:[FeFe] hydrogenase H-cluster radical SAM maturase HydG [Candidatus Omnitrophota bacterium]
MDLWIKQRIKQEQIEKYMQNDRDFIDEDLIFKALKKNVKPDPVRIRDILQKSLTITMLDPDETAALINVTDPELLSEMRDVAYTIKKKVYDNRIVTFAPLYMGNYCVNNCAYCGFRTHNTGMKRKMLTLEQVKKETEVLAGEIGHKRLIVVYGEHPRTDIDYMCDTIKAIYSVKVKTKNSWNSIRRVNVNAAPLSIEDLRRLKECGIGTYQVFQETYHRETYEQVHPRDTLKGHYAWRLYCMHRAMEAGIDDVGIGVLFGLYDWRFEVLALLLHSQDLEKRFGVGPHTISFPRLEPAADAPFVQETKYKVSDDDFKKLITIIRLSVPHTGMIVTARESAQMRRDVITMGCTQTDASTRIGIGAYSDRLNQQEQEKQQFLLGDTRELDDVIREFAEMGYITSFCTAGYRCGRTGECIMDLLKTGAEGKFCKLNAVLTFREWLDDFASSETKAAGEKVIKKEIEEVRSSIPTVFPTLMEYYERTRKGERDLYF